MADDGHADHVQGWGPDSWEKTFGRTSSTELLDRCGTERRCVE